MADPSTVDWNYQVRNRPPLSGVWTQVNPSAGPFSGPYVIVDASTGVAVASGPTLSLLLASLTQEGVIGTAGGQQVQGSFVVWDDLVHNALWLASTNSNVQLKLADSQAVKGVFPSTWSGILFGEYPAAGLLGSANSGIVLDGSTAKVYASATGHGGQMPGGFLSIIGSSYNDADLSGLDSSRLSLNALDSAQLYRPSQLAFDLTDGTSGGNAFFSINQRTSGPGGVGIWNTLAEGSTVCGGIITAKGTGTLTGDVTGTLAGTVLSALQTYPVLLTSPALNDVLTWNGSDWVNAPSSGGTPYEILRAGGSVVVGTSGQITATPASGQDFYLYNQDGMGYLVFFNDGATYGEVGTRPWLAAFPGGQTYLYSAHGQLALDDSGYTYLGITAGSAFVLDPSQNLQLTFGAGKGFGTFGAAPVVQQTALGTTTGFTAGSGTAARDDSTYTGGVGSSAYTVGDAILAMKNYGWLAM